MTALIPFAFEDHLVRIHDRNGDLWFVAKDVCAVLGLVNSRKATADLDEDERDCVTISDAIGRDRETTIISEPGFWKLIQRSRKPEAKRLDRFVRHEVLPQIRKTGRYDPALPAERRDEDDWSADEARINLAKVAEYRKIYGPKAARWKAQELGFSKPPAHTRRQRLEYDPDLGREVLVREDEEDDL